MTQPAAAVPLVSIVIPTYNHAAYLEAAIRSVLEQSHPAVELIVLDDGSTDGTRALLERHGTAFRWECQANMGQARTLNKGWSMARGAILGYLSADDLLHRDAAAAAVEALAAHPEAVVVYPDTALVDAQSRIVYALPAREYAYADMLRRFECAIRVGAFFRRAAYERCGGWNPELSRMPDLDFWLRVALHGSVRRIPRVLGYHRVHAASESFSQPSAGKADESLRIIENFYEKQELPGPLRALRKPAFASAYLLSARLHLYAGRLREGFSRFGIAIALDPRLLFGLRGYRALIVGILGRARWWFVSLLGRQ